MLLSMMSTMRAKQSACFLLNAPFHSSDSFIFLSPWNTNILYRHKERCGVCRNGRMANIVDIIEAAPLFVWAFVELGLFKIISLSNRNKVECSARTPLRIQGYSCIHVCSWVLKALFSPFLRRFGARSYAKTDDFRLRKNPKNKWTPGMSRTPLLKYRGTQEWSMYVWLRQGKHPLAAKQAMQRKVASAMAWAPSRRVQKP
jgi:hypothetical protein